MSKQMGKVLCVDETGNCRSLMMAALLQKKLGDTFVVESAGVRKESVNGLPVNVYVDHLMRKREVDFTSHRSQWLGDLDLSEFSHIVCVDEKIELETLLLLAGYRIEVFCANVPNSHKEGWGEYREFLAFLDKDVPDIAHQIIYG